MGKSTEINYEDGSKMVIEKGTITFTGKDYEPPKSYPTEIQKQSSFRHLIKIEQKPLDNQN